MPNVEARNYRGTKDYLGQEANLRGIVTGKIVDVFQRFGFEPLETPVIELRDTLLGKYGEEGNNLTYFFRKGGEEIGLRYDHTVPLARVVAQHLNEIVLPYRRYTVGPVFRADTPQKGRFRQFNQCDFDIIGVSSPIADAEVVAITYNVLKELGFNDFEVQICDRRLLDGMAKAVGTANRDQVFSVLRSWDKITKASRDQISQELSDAGNSKDVIDNFNALTDKLLQIEGTNHQIVDQLRGLLPEQSEIISGIKALTEMVNYLEAFGIPNTSFRINPTLARGLDYYTGPIFETVVKQAGVGSITGGGRFDNLIKTLGGPDTHGTGSSFGLERIIAVMDQLRITPKEAQLTEIFVTVFDPQDIKSTEQAIKLVSSVRDWGFKAEMYMGDGKLGKQFQLADRRNCDLVLVVGPDEEKQGLVTVKNLQESKGGEKTNQTQIGNQELHAFLSRALRNRAQ